MYCPRQRLTPVYGQPGLPDHSGSRSDSRAEASLLLKVISGPQVASGHGNRSLVCVSLHNRQTLEAHATDRLHDQGQGASPLEGDQVRLTSGGGGEEDDRLKGRSTSQAPLQPRRLLRCIQVSEETMDNKAPLQSSQARKPSGKLHHSLAPHLPVQEALCKEVLLCW